MRLHEQSAVASLLERQTPVPQHLNFPRDSSVPTYRTLILIYFTPTDLKYFKKLLKVPPGKIGSVHKQ